MFQSSIIRKLYQFFTIYIRNTLHSICSGSNQHHIRSQWINKLKQGLLKQLHPIKFPFLLEIFTSFKEDLHYNMRRLPMFQRSNNSVTYNIEKHFFSFLIFFIWFCGSGYNSVFVVKLFSFPFPFFIYVVEGVLRVIAVIFLL